jgi:hypothetical protein
MAGHPDEAVTYLQQIRKRVGYTAENNYGLQANLAGDQATCMSAILYERQIEFAYEGKRFDDMRRWMLFDGGTQLPEGAPTSWQMTGFGGNTCKWLGFTQMNGQRRENMEFRVADKFGVGGTTYDSDPLLKVIPQADRDAVAVDLRKDLAPQTAVLAAFYKENFVRKVRKGDARDAMHNDEYMKFFPKYYFLGFSTGAQNSNKGLPQTIGWEDYNNGNAAGTFDPFAE